MPFVTAEATSDRCDGAGASAVQLSLLGSYDTVRPLASAELRLLPSMMRAAALRFWISRLWDFYLPRDAHLLTPHDPGHFERVLRARVETPWHFTRV